MSTRTCMNCIPTVARLMVVVSYSTDYELEFSDNKYQKTRSDSESSNVHNNVMEQIVCGEGEKETIIGRARLE